MTLNDYFQSHLQCDLISVQERGLYYDAKFGIIAANIPVFSELHKLKEIIASRDMWTLNLISPIDGIYSLTNSTVDNTEKVKQYEEFCSNLDEEDYIKISFGIDKKIIDSTVSIYDYHKFTESILEMSTAAVLALFSVIMKNQEFVVFQSFDHNVLFSTPSILFTNAISNITKNFARQKRLKECQFLTHIIKNIGLDLLPDDFHIETEQAVNPLHTLFQRIEACLSMIYIANTATIIDSSVKCTVNGQRIFHYSFDMESNEIINDELYKIYNWIYTDGNTADKALLARNVLSLHCRYCLIYKTDESLFSTILANFSLYLKNNVQQYLEVKNKLSEFICNVTCQIGERATELLNDMKKNLFAIFGFLLTVIISNIISDSPLDNILTNDICFILEGILLGSFIYLCVCVYETSYKLVQTDEGYDLLKNNYSDSFSIQELNEMFDNDKAYDKTVKHIRISIIIFTAVWAICIVVAFLVICHIQTK